MNIFVISHGTDSKTPCPIASARHQLDKHVVKMPLETAQILCTIARNAGFEDGLYKATHRNHPCTLWAGASFSNFRWTVQHGLALCKEYTARYGKVHASQAVIERVDQLPMTWSFDRHDLTPFAQAMPDQYKNSDPVVAYQRYYLAEKAAIATWKRNQPDWWIA